MSNAARQRLDIVIPVYNEGANIVPTLRAIAREVKTPDRVLICYDREEDDTLPAITDNREAFGALAIEFVRNRKRGAHAAVLTGFARSDAPFVLVFPADDDYNAGILDSMVAEAAKGCDIVCASRFMAGGSMVGCPWLKAVLVRSANFTLYISPACRRTMPATAFVCSRAASSTRSQSSPIAASVTASSCW